MGSKVLELGAMSARDLKDVSVLGKMDPYAVVYLSDDPENKQKTPVHQNGGRSPSWNHTMLFPIKDAVALQPDKLAVIAIKHESTFGADKDLGRVDVSLKELLDRISGFKDSSAPLTVTYQVKRGSSGKTQGQFKMTCKLVDDQKMGYIGDEPYAQSTVDWVSSAHGSYTSTLLLDRYGEVPLVVSYPAQSYGIGVPLRYQGYDRPPQAGYAYGAYPPPGGYPPLGRPTAYPPPGGYPLLGGPTAYPPPRGPTAYSPLGGPTAYPSHGGYPPPGGPTAYPLPGGYLEGLGMRLASTVLVDGAEQIIIHNGLDDDGDF